VNYKNTKKNRIFAKNNAIMIQPVIRHGISNSLHPQLIKATDGKALVALPQKEFEMLLETIKDRVHCNSNKNLKALKGKIQFRDDYDYKAMREAT
jgi:hypothetical protein